MATKTNDKKGSSWFSSAILFLVAASFVIGSMQRSAFRSSNPVVINVGDYEIRADEFRKHFYQYISSMNQTYGPPKTQMDMERRIGQSIQSIITTKAIDIEINRIGIKVSEKYAMNRIRGRKEFCDEDGKFNPSKFARVLDSMRIREKEYIEEEKKRIAFHRFETAMKLQVSAPSALIDTVIKGYFRKKYGVYKLIKYDDFKITQAPSEDELRKMYDTAKEKPKSKELRKCQFIHLSPTAFAKKITVTDKEIEVEYKGKAMAVSLEKAKEQVRASLMQKKAQEEIAKLVTQIEDAIGAGQKLSDIAKKLSLDVISVELSNDGKDTKGTDAINFKELGSTNDEVKKFLLAKIFALEVGADPDINRSPSGESFFIALEKVTPSGVLSFDAAKMTLTDKWKKQKQVEAAKKASTDEKKKLSGKPDTWKNLPGMIAIDELSISNPNEAIPQPVITSLLVTLAVGQTTALPSKDGIYVIGLIKVDDTTKPDDEKKKALADAVKYHVQMAFWNSFAATLAKKQPHGTTKGLAEVLKNEK